MTRRDAIKRTTFLMGATLSASAITGILSGCQPEPTGPNWTPEHFTKEQGKLIMELANQIIPTTDTPGAVDVGVHSFIDGMVKNYYDAKNQKKFMDGLAQFSADAQEANGKAFLDLNNEEKIAYLTKIDAAAFESLEDNEGGRPFWTKLKGLTLTGFYISEVGATEVLQYSHVPGKWEGCVTMEEAGGKAYAV